MNDIITYGPRPRSFTLLTYAGWVAASAAGAMLGMAALYALLYAALALVPGVNEDRFAGRWLLPLLGAAIGAGQWLLLRARIRRAGWWLPATALGVWAGGMLHFRAAGVQLPAGLAGLLLGGALLGLCVGLAQLAVWRPNRRTALGWLLLSALGWLCMAAVVGETLDGIGDLLALGAIPAAFTGVALLWTSNPLRPAPGEHD
jgi:hypothetical protein